MKKLNESLGIDFGTSVSRMAVFDGKTHLIPNSADEFETPSTVAFFPDGRYCVGTDALRLMEEHPEWNCSVSTCRKYIGTNHIYKIWNQTYSAEEIAAMILKYMKNEAEKFVGERITSAAITIPTAYNPKQISAMWKSVFLAGFEGAYLIRDSVAAAFSIYDKTIDADLFEKDPKIKDSVFMSLGDGFLSVDSFGYSDRVLESLTQDGRTLSVMADEDIVELVQTYTERSLKDSCFFPKDVKVYLFGRRQDLLIKAVYGIFQSDKIINLDSSNIAEGASIWAAKPWVRGSNDRILLLDGLPWSITVGIKGGDTVTVLEQNCTIPIRRTFEFRPASDYQTAVDCTVYAENIYNKADKWQIAQLHLDNIKAAKSEEVVLEFIANISDIMRMEFSIKELVTGNEESVECYFPHSHSILDEEVVRQRINEQMTSFQRRKEYGTNNNEDFIAELILAFDSLSFGLEQKPDNDLAEGFAIGMRATQQQILHSMEKLGVYSIQAEGENFDPHIHEAISHVVDDRYPNNYVLKELRKGFMYKDKLLRASQVIVAN